MSVLTVFGLVVCVVLIGRLLDCHAKEYALLVTLCASVGILLYLSDYVRSIVEFISQLLDYTGNGDIYGILLKALGICIVTNVAMDVCKDSNQNTLSGVVLMVGKVAILLLALPLLQELFNTVVRLIPS